MNILVLGGAGFVGCHLVRRCLCEPGNRVTVLDSLDPRCQSTTANLHEVWSQIDFIQGDIRNEVLLAEIVAAQDIIFNCAAQTSHPLSLRDPLFDAEINCLGNLVLLEAVRKYRSDAVVVYPSSSTVIGRATQSIVDEWSPERPLDIYSANKGVSEKYYYIYHSVHDLKTVILRLPNLYGPYGKCHADFGFINYFIHLAATGQEITLFGAADQTRNVLYVEDVADLLYQAAQNERLIGEILFAAHDEHLTVRSVAEQIIAVFGSGTLRSIAWPDERRRIDVQCVTLSAQRLHALTGWRPQYTFEAGLQRTKAIMERMVVV